MSKFVGIPGLFVLVFAGKTLDPLLGEDAVQVENRTVREIVVSEELKEDGQRWCFTVLDHTTVSEVCGGACQTEGNNFACGNGGSQFHELIQDNWENIDNLRRDTIESNMLDPATEVEDELTSESQEDSQEERSSDTSERNNSEPESLWRQIRGFSLPTTYGSRNFSWGLDYIGSYKVASKSGKGVHIYILDTGIRRLHKEFDGRAIADLDLTGDTVWKCNGESMCADDIDGHGTHMAGVAGGKTFGVAPQATLHAIKISKARTKSPGSKGMAGIEYVAEKGSRPAVALWTYQFEFDDPVFRIVMAAANDAGVVIAVGAGNEGVDVCRNIWGPPIPAIKVASTTRWNSVFAQSNFGSCMDLLAPGTDIKGPSHTSDFSILKRSGTMTAASFVAGASALLLETDPTLTYQKVLDSLQSTSLSGRVANLHGLPDKFLYVNEDPDQVSPVTEVPQPKCPDFAAMQEPDVDGDCFCHWGNFCSKEGTTLDCPTSVPTEIGGLGGYVFKWTCTDCRCYKISQSEMRPAVSVID